MNNAAALIEPSIDQQRYAGPILSISKSVIGAQMQSFKRHFPSVRPHFAVKSNPHPQVLAYLQRCGAAFEVASSAELLLMQALAVPAVDIIFSHPIKTPASVRQAREYGVMWYAFDSLEELDMLATHAPGCHYELRLETDGAGAVWPRTNKFGVSDIEAYTILQYARQHRLPVQGLTFHVGSQCLEAHAWHRAIKRCLVLFKEMKMLGLNPLLLNIGGGFPTAIGAQQLPLADIAKVVNPLLKQLPSSVKQLVAEPGRFMVGAAGTLQCQVINAVLRKGHDWAFLDCGYYNGLMELSGGYDFSFESPRRGRLSEWVIAGPTCDSIDLFEKTFLLPNDTQAGDVLTLKNIGAYSNACASNFNGFSAPQVRLTS